MQAPLLSVIVTTCQDSPGLRCTLERVAEQTKSLGGELLLVINRAEEDFPLPEELSQQVDRVVFEAEPGKSNALNRAVKSCRGEVVAFSDDDALPDEGWLAAITAPLLEAGTEFCGTGGQVLPVFPEGGPPPWYRQILARSTTHFLGPLHFLGNRPLEYKEPAGAAPLPLGANCAYRRDALLSHPFRSELGPNRRTRLRGGEDTVFALQCLMEGRRILYVPGARVYHPVTPDRMDLSYVREGYRIQGREYVRILSAVGRPLPEKQDIQRKIKMQRWKSLRGIMGRPSRKLRRSLQRDYLTMILSEMNET